MIKAKKRKEVLLDEETIAILEFQAERQGRKLKNYMEFILKEKADDFELTDEHKAMIDEMLAKEERGELNFISEEEFRKRSIH
jgi:3-isopropylmalate dehydratase small subunit